MHDALDQADRAVQAGARLIEWRIDALVGGDDAFKAIQTLLRDSPASCIVTCRPLWEGGLCEVPEIERLELLRNIIESDSPPKYVDLEMLALERSPEAAIALIDAIKETNTRPGVEVGLILSSHDFKGRPVDLIQKIETMTNEMGVNVIKVVWLARSLRDNLEAFAILRERSRPTLALCMGEFGLMSRVLAPKFGGFITFASEAPGHETAPGQASIEELRNLYRFDSIGRDTKVYGVIGWPVGHSLSPKIHNAGFDAIEHDGVYLPLPVPKEYEHFKATVGSLIDDERLDFRGASVTIPHKENLIRFVMERGGSIEPMAGFIGAANTLVVNEDGSIEAINTDCPAAIKALCARLDIEPDALQGKRVAILGAGGVARGIVAGLAQLGAKVTIFNRSQNRAEAMVEAFRELAPIAIGEALQLIDERFDIYINGTPLGMNGGPDPEASPLPDGAPLEGALVMETVYNPVETPLIRQAEANGAITLDGLAMFVRQAGTQFKHWTGRALPVDVMDVDRGN
ncbi:MAG: type I 3-dehydroquinate dehydratase [Planctomycetota bacterium]|nr:type I 3-dehydroquinate dehydratase [Planctomycetota bacterium]